MRTQKYMKEIKTLVNTTPKSTRQIMIELEKEVDKKIGWAAMYIKLKILEEKGLVESTVNNAGTFWVRK